MKELVRDGIGQECEFKTYHPLVIFAYFAIVIGITMSMASPGIMVLSMIVAIFYSILLKGRKAIKFNLIICLSTIVFTTVFNTLFTHDGETVLFFIKSNRITLEAAIFGLFSGVMISTVIIWFSCFNILVNGEMIMYLFSRISSLFGLLISMILRYIPLLKNRYEEIDMGQKCLGKKGGLVKKVSILIAWSLESSIESADSMASRGYGLKGRTSFYLYKWSLRDKILIGVFAISIMAIIVLANLVNTKIYFYPVLVLPKISWIFVLNMGLFLLISLIPPVIDIAGEYRWKKLESKI